MRPADILEIGDADDYMTICRCSGFSGPPVLKI